jgi:hypothetical protein
LNDHDKLLHAQKVYKRDKEALNDIYRKASEDLDFLSDEPYAQWDKGDYEARVSTGRPALTIDQLSQFIHQVANDIRMNTPSINIIPSDQDASQESAEVMRGLIKEIEYRSNADDVYDTASLNAIRCSMGFIRVDHEYARNKKVQQAVIKRVVNPLSVFLDSNSIECDGRDAMHATVIEKITVERFKELYPKNNPVSFEDADSDFTKLDDEDYISIAECFKKEIQKEIVIDEYGEEQEEETIVIYRYKMSGDAILEETVFPGDYIPIVPVYGEETWIKGERHIFSLIRKSKDAQRMFNVWKSLETELLRKAPNAPIMAAEGTVEDYKADWQDPQKSMVLRYKQTDTDGNPAPPPQRLEPPTIPTGVVNASRGAVEDIKATMGIYNAALGMRSNESSGIAIRQRQQESDVATYHFSDNLVRSITQVGRILVGMIPVIYDTPRILKIIGSDDEAKTIGVNGEQSGDQPETIDLLSGDYDVRVTTGASTSTLRQEGAEFLSNVISQSPDMLNIAGDLLFGNMDFKGADALAERMKKVIDPKFLQDDEGQDPMVMALQAQLQEAQSVIQQMQVQLQEKQTETQIKIQAEQNDAEEARAKVQVQVAELELEKSKVQSEVELRRLELELKAKELSLKEMELQAKVVQESQAITPELLY